MTLTHPLQLSSASDVKNLIVKVADAQKIVNEADASVLANMDIVTPDTVAVPIVIVINPGSGRPYKCWRCS